MLSNIRVLHFTGLLFFTETELRVKDLLLLDARPEHSINSNNTILCLKHRSYLRARKSISRF